MLSIFFSERSTKRVSARDVETCRRTYCRQTCVPYMLPRVVGRVTQTLTERVGKRVAKYVTECFAEIIANKMQYPTCYRTCHRTCRKHLTGPFTENATKRGTSRATKRVTERDAEPVTILVCRLVLRQIVLPNVSPNVLPLNVGQASGGGRRGGAKLKQHEHCQVFCGGGERMQRVRQEAPRVSILPSRRACCVQNLLLAVANRCPSNHGLPLVRQDAPGDDDLLSIWFPAVERRLHCKVFSRGFVYDVESCGPSKCMIRLFFFCCGTMGWR